LLISICEIDGISTFRMASLRSRGKKRFSVCWPTGNMRGTAASCSGVMSTGYDQLWSTPSSLLGITTYPWVALKAQRLVA